jgi:hypothetical protein
LKKHSLIHANGTRLTYCTNVHPLQNEAIWREKIGFFGPKMAELTGKRPFPLGLWFNEGVLAAVEPRAGIPENIKKEKV